MTLTLGQPLPPDRAVLDGVLTDIVASGRWSNDGAVVRQLEQVVADDLGWRTVVATSSGTMALTVALLAAGLPRGAEVITSPLTFPATVQAIESAGGVPVFAGVDPQTLLLDPAAVAAALTPRTAAVVPVHLFGLAVDPAIDRLAAAAGLAVVHDAAHAYAFGPVVGRGAATAYSLHATKLLHTGEGGLVATDDPGVADRARRIRNFGLRDDLVIDPGTNAKMPELSAALGLAVRTGLEAEISARQRVRDGYAAVLTGGRVRQHAAGRPHALVMEVVRCDPSDQLDIIRDLARVDVAGRRFPALCEPGQRFSTVRLVGGAAPDLARLARSVVALPLHGRVTSDQIAAIGRAIGG